MNLFDKQFQDTLTKAKEITVDIISYFNEFLHSICQKIVIQSRKQNEHENTLNLLDYDGHRRKRQSQALFRPSYSIVLVIQNLAARRGQYTPSQQQLLNHLLIKHSWQIQPRRVYLVRRKFWKSQKLLIYLIRTGKIYQQPSNRPKRLKAAMTSLVFKAKKLNNDQVFYADGIGQIDFAELLKLMTARISERDSRAGINVKLQQSQFRESLIFLILKELIQSQSIRRENG